MAGDPCFVPSQSQFADREAARGQHCNTVSLNGATRTTLKVLSLRYALKLTRAEAGNINGDRDAANKWGRDL